MATVIQATVLKRDSIDLVSDAKAQTFNIADIENARNAYYVSGYNYDISTVQLDGGILDVGNSNVPQGAHLGVDFYYRSGADFRRTRYFISSGSTAFATAVNDTAVLSVIASILPA